MFRSRLLPFSVLILLWVVALVLLPDIFANRTTSEVAPLTSLPIGVRPPDAPGETGGAVPGEFIVRFAPSLSVSSQAAAVTQTTAEVQRQLRLPGYSLVHVPLDREDEVVTALLAQPGVESVEPNLILYAFFEPNDLYYPLQWHFPQIDLPTAWNTTTGTGATVAVIDTGVAYETCGVGTCGDNYFQAPDFGSTTFVSPFDAIDNDLHPNDGHGHGTHVASTIAESTNNATGASGVAYNAQIMPVQVLSAAGFGTVADGIDGILWAAHNGADVINLSLGHDGTVQAEEDAIDHAVEDHGVVVVAAAGNAGTAVLGCPACYPGTISVGATRYDNTRSYYSSYGIGTGGHTLDIVAPGGDVTVDQNGDGYGDGVFQQTFSHACGGEPVDVDYSSFVYCFFQGTSMATPHVAGVAALLRSIDPTLTPQEVRDILTSTADDLGPAGYDTEYGYGLLNAAAAVAAAGPPPTPGMDSDNDGCTDDKEAGPNPSFGGSRNPNNVWDFFDTPDSSNVRDKAVSISDIGRIVARFGTTGDPGIDPLSSPPSSGYHTAFDRTPSGPNVWNLGPADGSVAIQDIGLIVAQFGHSCQ